MFNAPVCGCFRRTLGDRRTKKSRKLLRYDVALVVMPVTAARHMLIEIYKAISL